MGVQALKLLFAITFLIPIVSYGALTEGTPDSSQDWVLTRTHGMKFYRPEEIFSGRVRFIDIPEAEYINSQGGEEQNRHMQKIRNFLESNGIALGLGINSNRDSHFDLYAPFVDILLDEPAAEFGSTRASEVGKMHFLTHDSVHLYMGMPGPRLSDLKDKAAAKEKLKKILMREEALASVWTSLNHAKWYWKWRRMQEKGTEGIQQFDQYNKGLASIGHFSSQDYTQLIEAYMSGRYWDMKKIYAKSIDYDTFIQARDAGVPMLFPDFSKTLTAAGEKFLVKTGFPYLLPYVHLTDKKFGFKSLWAYTDLQADFYLSDWYVQWADTFKVGEPLDSLEKSLEEKSQQIKRGEFFADVEMPKEGMFDIMYVRNNLAQFGRKLIELQILSKKENLNITAAQVQSLDGTLQQAIKLNEYILNLKDQNRNVSKAEINYTVSSFRQLMAQANAAMPIESIVPRYLRQAYGDYRTFWFDTFAVLLPRPAGLTKFLSAKGIWAEAQRQRLERLQAKAKGKAYQGVDVNKTPIIVADLEKQLATRYNDARRGQPVAEQNLSSNFYINKLLNYKKAMQTQVNLVFIPQLHEHNQIAPEVQRVAIQQAERFSTILSKRIDEFAQDYEKIFVNYERSPELMERLVNTESDLKWAVDRALAALADTLDLLDAGKKDISKSMQPLSEISQALESGKAVSRGVKDILRNILPYKKDNVKMICSVITRLCLKNESLQNFFDKMPLGPLSGSSQNKAQLKFTDIKGKQISKHNLPANAVIIMTMNHEHALMDLATMRDVARSLDADTVSVLTNKEVWPIYDIRTNKDENVIFKQDQGVKQKVLSLIDKNKSRFMFAIYPEGDIPYFGGNFPIPAHFGAFNIARSAAVANKGKRPVYLVKVFGNFQAAVNSQGKKNFEVEIMSPELVPDHVIGGRDEWIESKRAEFEKLALERRGTETVDLINREKVQGARVRAVAPVAEYTTPGQFMTDFMKTDGRTVNNNKSCKDYFKQ